MQSIHRSSPVAWVFAAASMAVAALLVIVHWAPRTEGHRGSWELAGVAALGLCVLVTYLLEGRRQRKLDSLDE